MVFALRWLVQTFCPKFMLGRRKRLAGIAVLAFDLYD
jgi:hypothetical protein